MKTLTRSAQQAIERLKLLNRRLPLALQRQRRPIDVALDELCAGQPLEIVIGALTVNAATALVADNPCRRLESEAVVETLRAILYRGTSGVEEERLDGASVTLRLYPSGTSFSPFDPRPEDIHVEVMECPTMETIDVVAAVIVRDGRLLLAQRTPEQDHSWLWHCPGGKCLGPEGPPGTTGESWEDAAIRETREELGLGGPVTVRRDESGNVQPVAEYVFQHESGIARNIGWYIVDIGDQKPLPIEGVGLGWFTQSELVALASNHFLTAPTKAVFGALYRCTGHPWEAVPRKKKKP